MRADDLVHVVICKKLWMWNLTLPLVANEQSYLREEPIQGHSSLENPEEQEHWVLTRRAPPPLVYGACPKNETCAFSEGLTHHITARGQAAWGPRKFSSGLHGKSLSRSVLG